MWEKCNQDSEHTSAPHAACVLRREQERSCALCSMYAEERAGGEQTVLFCLEKILWLNFTEWRIRRWVLHWKGDLLDIQKNTIIWETVFQAFSWLAMSSSISSKQSLHQFSWQRSWILIPWLHINVSVDVDSHAFLFLKKQKEIDLCPKFGHCHYVNN